MKDKKIAYLLCIFTGIFGLHRFYLGKFGSGLVYLLTFGFATIGVWIDLFNLSRMVDEYNHLYKKDFGDLAN